MLLTADVGNTETVLGVFDGPELPHTWRLSTLAERLADELALVLSGLLEHRGLSLEKLTGFCIASVVPDVNVAAARDVLAVPHVRARGRGAARRPGSRSSRTTRARWVPTAS